jgi:hypothetical protein
MRETGSAVAGHAIGGAKPEIDEWERESARRVFEPAGAGE